MGNQDGSAALRIGTTAATRPGNYNLKFTLILNGESVTTTYAFTVLPVPTSPGGSRPLVFPSFPGLAIWQVGMRKQGASWCSYREKQNTLGNFVSFGWEDDYWYYNGT